MLFRLPTLPTASVIPAMLKSASSSLALLLDTVCTALATAAKYICEFFAGRDAPPSMDKREAQPTTTTTALDATATADPTTTALPQDVVENEYTEIEDPSCGTYSLPPASDASDECDSSSASTAPITESSDSDFDDSDRGDDRLATVRAKYESALQPLLYLTEPTMFAAPRRPLVEIYAHIKIRTDSNNPTSERVRKLNAENRVFFHKLAAITSSIGRAKVAPRPLEDAGRARLLEDERLGRATPVVSDANLADKNCERQKQLANVKAKVDTHRATQE